MMLSILSSILSSILLLLLLLLLKYKFNISFGTFNKYLFATISGFPIPLYNIPAYPTDEALSLFVSLLLPHTYSTYLILFLFFITSTNVRIVLYPHILL